jgi:hypothetical protein
MTTTFSAFMQKIAGSGADDWNVIAQPSLLHHLSMTSHLVGGEPHHHMAVEHPSYAYALRTDLSVSMLAGIVCAQTFAEPWASAFGDAHTEYLTLLYNGAPVFRTLYVSVDAEHCWLPLPKAGTNAVARTYSDVIRLLNSLTRDVNYDDYAKRAGLHLVDEPWPQ